MTDPIQALHVVVAMLTYRRPDDLAAALDGLLPHVRGTSARAEILVVDNDPEASARSLVEGLAAPEVRYVHEPHPGIAAARNRALDEGTDADVLVFIDDDERPSERWLADLLDVYVAQRPAGVVGPVVSEYDVEPDAWIRAGRFFDRRRLPTGTVVEVAATNNLLLDMSWIRRYGFRFDEEFGLSGGSDTLFTRQISARGGRFVWCDEAVVVDVVPASRVTREWVLQRAYRSGNSWSRTAVKLAGSPVRQALVRVRLTLKGLVRTAGGAVRWAVGTATGSLTRQAGGLRTVKRGTGMIAGAWGHVYSEYRRG